jgi:hypothetical protein
MVMKGVFYFYVLAFIREFVLTNFALVGVHSRCLNCAYCSSKY